MSTFFNSKNTVQAEVTGLTTATIADLKSKILVPRGSALQTGSGQLAPPINAVVHAATGTMADYSPSQSYYEPSLQSVEDSIAACFELGKLNHNKRLAIPFIGGKIFKQRIFVGQGLSVKEQDEKLVACVVRSGITHAHASGLDFCFVAFDSLAHALFLHDLTTSHSDVDIPKHLVQGDIIDFTLHGCDSIVNAANMEVKFGGGISGAIAQGTNQLVKIDSEAKAAIAQFWSDYESQ